MKINEYLVDLTDQDLDLNTVLLSKNNNGNLTIIIKSSQNINYSTNNNTKNLIIRTNVLLNESINAHLIICKDSTGSKEQYFKIIYEYLFSQIKNNKSSEEILMLIDSLEEIFTMNGEISKKGLIGLVGELLILDYFLDNNILDIYKYYHRNPNSKFDFEFDHLNKLDVKTTSNETRNHKFSHSQLINSNYDIIIASVLLNEIEVGMSISELLFNIESKTVDAELIIFCKKLRIEIDVNNLDDKLFFDYESTYNSIKFFSTKSIPKIENVIDDSISEISYNVNLSNIESMIITELMNVIGEVI